MCSVCMFSLIQTKLQYIYCLQSRIHLLYVCLCWPHSSEVVVGLYLKLWLSQLLEDKYYLHFIIKLRQELYTKYTLPGDKNKEVNAFLSIPNLSEQNLY